MMLSAFIAHTLSQLTGVKPHCSCSSMFTGLRGGVATPPVNPVVAPCEDMLPYIPILIHHLWNVRKCVVTKRTRSPSQSEEDVSHSFEERCVFVQGRQVRGTCAVSVAPRELLMGSPGLLEKWPPCPNG